MMSEEESDESESSSEEVTALAEPVTIPLIDRIPMDERRRRLIKIVMLIRYTFRGYFGLKFANKWGFYVDRHMSRKIHEFQDWLDYPNGDHVLDGYKKGIWSTVVSKDGYFLFTGDESGMIKMWNMLDNQMIREWKAHENYVRSLAFQSGLLVSGSADKSITIWDTLRDYQLVHSLEGHSDYVNSVDINEKATQVISGSDDKSIRIWSVKTGECIRVMMGHSHWVTSLQLIGNLILSGSYDRSLKIWDPSDGTEVQSVNEGIDFEIEDLSINCDASLVACAFRDAFSLFSWPELKCIRKVDTVNPFRCAFHPIHPTILAASDFDNHSVLIFDLTNYDVIRTLEGHSDVVCNLCFTPDGTRLVSVSDDKSVSIWDVSDV